MQFCLHLEFEHFKEDVRFRLAHRQTEFSIETSHPQTKREAFCKYQVAGIKYQKIHALFVNDWAYFDYNLPP